MKFDPTFPNYARRMEGILFVLLVMGTLVLTVGWNWIYGLSWLLGSLFHILFFQFLRAKYMQWVKAARKPDWMGQRLVVFTMLRFILEIICCGAVIFSPLNIIAFLCGLLTLPAAILGERLVSLIKE
jgi:hypothetical protein